MLSVKIKKPFMLSVIMLSVIVPFCTFNTLSWGNLTLQGFKLAKFAAKNTTVTVIIRLLQKLQNTCDSDSGGTLSMGT